MVVTDSLPVPGRQIDQQEIEILPFHPSQQLIDELILISVAPDDRIIGVLQQERHRRDLHVVGLKRNDSPGRADLQLLSFRPDHLGNVGTMNVHVANPDMPAFEREADRQVGGAGTFPHSTLVAHDQDLIFDPFHAFGDEPPAVAFLVFLTGFILVANGAGPHIGAGISAAAGTGL
jgi:hypothetical protein